MMLGPPRDLPVRSAWMPAVTVRVALMLLGIGLSFVVYAGSGWVAVGILLSFLAVWEPKVMLGWGLIVFLAIGQLSNHDALTWQLLVLIAGLHLLHLLSMQMLELPWYGWMSPQVLKQPLLRFAAIQIPCQLFAVAALLLLAPGAGGHRPLSGPVVAVIGALALAALAVLLLRPRVEAPNDAGR